MLDKVSRQNVFARLESDVRSYSRRFPETFATGSGAWLTTKGGRRVLDLLCGAGALNYGHNDPCIIRQVLDYIMSNGVVHSLDLETEAKEKFLLDFENIVLTPRGLDYKIQFPGPAGTNAVEAALKLARKLTHRPVIAAFKGGFHGMSLGSLAVSSNARARAAAGVPLEHVEFWPYEGDLGPDRDAIAVIEEELANRRAAERPAAVIVELVQGEGGVRSMSKRSFARLAGVCKEHEVLLIVDDIQAGCGRTGKFFSFEDTGVVPDIVLLSKALSGFGAPLSVVLMRRELDVWRPGEHTGTFRGNNLAFVGASAALTQYWRTAELESRIRRLAHRVISALSELAVANPDQLEFRGRGLLVGLRFREKVLAAACSRQLFDRGIMAETCGQQDDVLKLLPPLNIDEQDLAAALEEIEIVVSSMCGSGYTHAA